MTMLRSKHSQLLAAGLKKIFTDYMDSEMKSGYMEQVFKVENSDKAYEDYLVMAGLPPMPEVIEGDSFSYSNLLEAGNKRLIHLKYGLGSRYSYELSKDDQYGIIKKVPSALVRSGKFVREMVPFNVINLGFTTITTANGKSLFNNQQDLVGGANATNVGPGVSNVISAAGTYPNRPATDIDLSLTGLELMTQHNDRMIDQTGIPITSKITKLLIPPELKFIARELLDSELKPYTTDNEKNPITEEGLTYLVIPYLTSSSAWFGIGAGHELVFYNREPLSQDFDDDFDTETLKHVARQRFSCGAPHWINTWGSNGP